VCVFACVCVCVCVCVCACEDHTSKIIALLAIQLVILSCFDVCVSECVCVCVYILINNWLLVSGQYIAR